MDLKFYVSENRIFALDENDNTMAEITFPKINADTVMIDHTFVDDSLQGQGIAGSLVKAVADVLRQTGKKAEVTCSYARNWFDRHPEYNDILK